MSFGWTTGTNVLPSDNSFPQPDFVVEGGGGGNPSLLTGLQPDSSVVDSIVAIRNSATRQARSAAAVVEEFERTGLFTGIGVVEGISIAQRELVGAKSIPLLFYFPDATTFRSPYFYHTRINKLFMKKTTTTGISHWKQISD